MSALEPAARVRDWRRASHAAVCDSLVPWEHGTIVRASRYPSYYEYNLVRVERDPCLDVVALEALADEALGDLEHRRLDFEVIEAAEARRESFIAAGWKAMRLLWMYHEQPLPPYGPELEVTEVAYEDVDELRLAWHEEDFADHEYDAYRRAAREVAMSRDVTVLAAREQGRAVAFAQLERINGVSEISSVYVHPDWRGAGRGTALTRAAILAAGDCELWITADDEDRPKQLYARLGFRGAWTMMAFLKLP
jgi:predicted GNAT family acetyltransferase